MLLDETPIKDKNGIFFYTYGYQNFKDSIYVLPYYFPKKLLKRVEFPSNNLYKKIEKRRLLKRRYIRVHNVLEGLKIAKSLNYDIVVDPRYGIPMVRISRKDVIKIFNPYIRGKKFKRIIKMVSKFFDIPAQNIGISRSYLIDMYTDYSNVDICIEGEENSFKVIGRFKEFLDNYRLDITKKDRIKRHVNMLPKRLALAKSSIENKDWFSFYYKGKKIDFHFIKTAREADVPLIIKKIGPKEVRGKIVDNAESFFAPSVYVVEILSPRDYIHKRLRLITYSRFFAGAFKKDDTIKFRGTFRISQRKNSKEIEASLEEIIA